MAEQHLGHSAGAVRVAAGAAGGVPVPLMTGRERAGCPGLGQRGRAGLVLQHVQVVVQSQHLGVFPGGALVHGHEARPVQHLDFHRRQAHVQAAGSIAGRDRVVVLPHADPGPVIHRACSSRAGSNISAGSGISAGCSAANAAATVTGRPVITRPSSRMPAAAIRWFSAASDATAGTGTRCRRRNRPTSPSTPPFSWAPSLPGMQKNESNP